MLGLALLCVLAACADASTPIDTARPANTKVPPSPTLSTVAPVGSYQVQTIPNIAYGPQPQETLDLCLPSGASGARPGVILIHGGGWVNGDKGDFAQQCNYLASLGFVAATVNYRLLPAHIWPAQLVDVQLAVRFLRQNAASYSLDSSRMCGWGSSSGSQLAVFLGVSAKIHAGDEAQLYANQPVTVSCVIDEFGPVNLVTYQETQAQRGLTQLLLGGATPQSNPAAYQDASPYFDVSPQSAPELIIQGTLDTTVPPDQSQALYTSLQQARVSAQYIPYIGDHSFSGLSAQELEQIRAEEASYLVNSEHP